jgi:hypothetical protein
MVETGLASLSKTLLGHGTIRFSREIPLGDDRLLEASLAKVAALQTVLR